MKKNYILLFIALFAACEYTEASVLIKDNVLYVDGGIHKDIHINSFINLNNNFIKDKDKVYCGADLLEGADPESIEIVSLIHAKDKKNVYYCDLNHSESGKIDGADRDSFELVLENNYTWSRDKNKIYYHGCRNYYCNFQETEIDPETFVYLKGQIAKDNKYVYIGAGEQKEIDTATFEFLEEYYARDKNHLYLIKHYRGGTELIVIENIDPRQFDFLGGDYYFKSGGSIYFFNKKIETADTDSFQIVDNYSYYAKDKNNYFEKGEIIDDDQKIEDIMASEKSEIKTIEGDYSKDGFSVFLSGKIINYADPDTFEIINFPYSKDKNYIFYFWDSLPISADFESFKILDNDYSTDKNKVYYKRYIVEGADTDSFKLNYQGDHQAEDDLFYYYKNMLLRIKSLDYISPKNNTLFNRLQGYIVLKVEQKGEAYYLNPETSNILYLGRPADAFRVMREQSLGISEKDYNSFGTYAPDRLSGRIILRAEANGEAYYVNPTDLKMHYLGRPVDAFGVMRNLGLGISDSDFKRIID